MVDSKIVNRVLAQSPKPLPPKRLRPSSSVQPSTHAPKTRMQSYVRRQTLLKGLIEGKAIREIAPTLGLSPKNAANQAAVMLHEPAVQSSFCRILEAAGLTDDFLAAKVRELLTAEKIEYFSHEGVVTDQRTQPAHETQRKTLELATKLKGHLKDNNANDINIGLMQIVVDAINVGTDDTAIPVTPVIPDI